MTDDSKPQSDDRPVNGLESSSASGDGERVGDLPAVFGPYRIQRRIGEGGMGAVYLAENTETGVAYALKTPFFSQPDDESTIRRFRREARAATALQHPNIYSVHDVGEIDGQHYMTMDYVEGIDLGHWMQQEEVSTERGLIVAKKLALALNVAHESGIIHRDLKPANVMMTPEGEPVILDFGMARRFDIDESILTPTGAMVGTPGYMAPEQILANRDKIGPGSDLYSLGVILYELLTGWIPFSGSLATMLGTIVSDPPPDLTSHNPGLNPQLDGLVLKVLAKDPDDRYQSGKEFADAIDEYLTHGTFAGGTASRSSSSDGKVDKKSGLGKLFGGWFKK